ncbi:hypothetical protein [Dolichospermum sp. UHCC 0259]|uniref:hypothetical protein n=1 Tax=Dolichospermum sp. UHCC 0259 TaxID=2590010 RepID=UPI00157FBE3B|nr:hypothetical protein [Dolichospermum sp. UHCC 0259]
MEINKKNQFEINDLIDESVSNAVARRSEALDSVENLSDEEAKNVTGGALIKPIILGRIFWPPITTGIIVVNPVKF